MPDKKYLIEIPDMPDGSGVWDAAKWERNKDAFMAEHPDAKVFELGEYDETDSKESDQILLSFEDEASSGIWDQAKWERNKDAFTKDNPEAQVNRVRYVDYWGQKAEANRAEKAALQQPDAERNAKLAELGYYDDLSEGQREFNLTSPDMIGLKPLSSAIESNPVSGKTEYHDPRVQEFFANDTAYTEKMAEIARLDAEYDSNPSVIAQREWEAQRLAEQKAYAGKLEKQIKADLEENVDMIQAARGGSIKRGYDPYESQQMSYLMDRVAGEEAGSGEKENEKLERYTTSLKFLEKAKIARDVAGKGFGGAVIDWTKEGIMDAGTQDDVEAYNEIGDILSRLETEIGNLKPENITEEVFDKYLSKDEQALIKSFFEYNAAMAEAQQDMSRAYKGGKIFAESVPFMLEFLATGGIYKGAGRAATRAVEHALVSWISKATKKSVSKVGRKILSASVARGLSSALIGTAARTAVAPGTYDRMAEASVEIDKEGHLNRVKNTAIAAADMYVENLSEISGGLIGKGLGLIGKGAGRLIAKTPFSKIGGLLADSRLMQGISAFMPKLEALGFHGLPEEVGEEFIGNAIREVLNIQPGALKEMVSDDNFGAMLIGFAPMTLLGAAGGAISLGSINYEAAKLGNKMREMMADHYSAEEMDAMMSAVEGAGSAEEIQQAIKPMALAIASALERGMITQEQAAEEIEMLYQWGGFMAQNNSLLFGKKAQDNELANAKRAEMVDKYGRFWQEDETESVQVATLNNGSTVFVTSAPAEDGKITTIDVQTGKKGFANISDIASTEVEGEQIQSSNKMTMAAFLNGQIAMGRKTAEETRMTNERNAQIDALRAEITPGTRINLGTEGSPVYVFAKKTSNNGVTIVDETGMESTLGWEQAADALGKPIIVETDQQKLDAEVSARLQRLAERRMQRNISPAVENATAEAAEESAEVVAQEQKHIPLNEDGTVNEAAFWTQDPEGYAEWNDEQNQDGGQDTLRQIAISKAEMFALLAEAQSRQNTSNPAARKAAEKEAAIIAEKIQRLQAMEMKYAEALAEEKEAVKQTAATPTATMSEEQLEQMDTQYQGILGKTRIQSERVRVMQEYLDKLAENSAPIKVLTKDNYEEVMRAEGCPEDDIKRVGKALNRKRGGQVAGFASNGVTFVMANTIADINSARITYIHERQHLLNSQNPEVVKQFAAALGDKENALRILETFVGKNGLEEYKNDSIEKLADEIICRSMEIVYSTENYSVDLQNQGLSEEAINIINTIDNGQRTDKSLSSARRSSYVNGSRRENIEENGRNSEQVSGGILGEQETGSLGSSGRGDGVRRQGSTGEGAEVISEEQLNAPNSGTAQQITAADGEVLADTNGKGGVRFSIRTWNEGGRDYLAAWLANDAVLTEEEKADILARMDEFYKNALLYSDAYVPFGTWSDAEVRYDNEGNPLMSVVKANGDYAMNLDFSLVCKKRRPLNRLLRTLINRNAFGSYDLKERELAEINWILQEHGFEVACALCFVDSKRYRVAGVADVFAKLWNNLVTSLAPNGVQIAHFNYNDNPNVEPVENGLDTLPDDQLNWKKLDKAVANFKKGSVEYKVAQYLREHPEARKLVDATDFIEAEGFEAVKEANPDLLKFYNMKKGTGGPKASFGDVQYLNDILKSGKKFDAEKAYAVGGVRLQSFSDFVPHMYFDYMQLFAELAAKKLPLHAYTKEVLFAKIFGLTGAKINMSLVPAVVEGGVAPGLDAEGNYAWADPVTDAEGNVIQQGQSFPYDEAMAIQQTEGYSKNCGVIAVGISDAHIEKMLDDPNIPFIIPYHKSSLNAIVARMTNIDQYKDYTNVQNTRKASGSKLDKGTKDFNFNEYLHSLGESGTPQQAAQAYLDWCRENKFIPKFSQFAYHPNYYKLLQDFNTIDLTTGEYAPQGAVTMTFPTEESAFGNVETLIQQGLQEDVALEEKMEQEIDGIADQVIARLEEIAKEPKMSDKQRVEKMAELADERMTKIKEQSGAIDLVEEAKKADLRHRMSSENTLVPGHKKGQPMLSDAEMMSGISFRVSKNTKTTIESWCKKAGIEDFLTDSLIGYIDERFEDTTAQLCAAKWYLNGKINLPDEDDYKVDEAVKIAKKNKVDALSYNSPMDIIDKFGEIKSKEKAIDPDTVKEFSNKQELPEGIVVYDVQDDFEGQAAVRRVIDTHWGEDANPWCLAARIDGTLDTAKKYWQHYGKYPKRIAFKDGKLLAFFASNGKKTWWDRLDAPHEGIPYTIKNKEGEFDVTTHYELLRNRKNPVVQKVEKRSKDGKYYTKEGSAIEGGWDTEDRRLLFGPLLGGHYVSEYRNGVYVRAQYNGYGQINRVMYDTGELGLGVRYSGGTVSGVTITDEERDWTIDYRPYADEIRTNNYALEFDKNGQLMTATNYEGVKLHITEDGDYEVIARRQPIGRIEKGKEWRFEDRKNYSFEDGDKLSNLLGFLNKYGWERADYPATNPEGYDVLRNNDDARNRLKEAVAEVNNMVGREVLSVPAISFRVTRTDEQRERLFDKAKERFGLTNNFNAAGYMLPDGSLLDFSEANDGGDPNQRSLDHREIEGIIMDEGKEYDSRWMYLADFMNEGAIRLLPEYAGINLMKAPTKEQRQKLFDFIYKYNGEVILEIADERLNNVAYVEYDRRTSPSRIFRDIDRYFNEGIVPQQSGISFRAVNDNQAIFVSNAAKAVEGIKQEKATPEQWLKMIEKNGGLKAGEDKWMGLSDWLKASDKKTLTKQEVLDFINEHMIVIEEQHYGEMDEETREFVTDNSIINMYGVSFRDSFNTAFVIEENFRGEWYVDVQDYEEAVSLYNEHNEDKITIDPADIEYESREETLLKEWATSVLKNAEQNDGVKPINTTRKNYTTEGLDNLHEIALTVPTIESWNEEDDIHFGDAGEGRAVAWIRFGETEVTEQQSDNTKELQKQHDEALKRFKAASAANFEMSKESEKAWKEDGGYSWSDNRMPEEWQERRRKVVAELRESMKELNRLGVALDKKEGDVVKKVLVIDEIQSKRHQEGREKGYKDIKAERAFVEAKAKLAEKREALKNYLEFLESKYGIPESLNSERATEEEMQKLVDLRNAMYDADDELVAVRMANPMGFIPDAPFDKNWHELAMKRMLRYAAEEGYDVIAWTKGEQQAERYDIGGAVESIYYAGSFKEGIKDIDINLDTRRGGNIHLQVDNDGKVINEYNDFGDVENSPYTGKNLSEILGKELSSKVLSLEEEQSLSGDGLRIGGEGMKGFYDRMLPAFMNKYGKKWGVKVEDIELPNLEEAGRVMHSVPVTEEMKASVMGGQVMFRMRTEEEDAMEFAQSAIDDCLSRYNDVAEVKVFPVNEETAERFGYTLEELKKTGGEYVEDEDLIAIFANEDYDDSAIFENIFFHESIHKIASFFAEFVEIGEWLWGNAGEVGLQAVKTHIEENYKPSQYNEEMLTFGMSLAMSIGVAGKQEKAIPQIYRSAYRKILNEIGYEPEKESRRAEERISDSSRKEAHRNERKADEGGRGKEGETRTAELSTAERRVIGEYFPEFNKGEKGSVSFRFIGEKGAAALDKAEEATVRLDNLAVARQMEEAGKDAKAIKLATGWERGADNLWRYETADFSMKPTWINATTLEEAIKDDELFKAYPELRKTKVRLVHNSTDVGGKFSKAQNSIEAIGYSFESMQDALVHEVQHAIQEQEGFEGGGNPMIANAAVAMEWANKYAAIYDNSPLKKANNAYSDTLDIIGMMDDLRQLRTDRKNSEKIKDTISTILVRLEKLQNYLPAPELKKEFAQRDLWPSRIWDTYAWLDNYQGYIIGLEDSESITDEERKAARIKELMRDSSGIDAYHAITGEVEARNATKRRAMSYIERRQSLASETEDVAREDHLFINGALEELAKVMEKMQKGNVSFRTSLDLDEEFGDALFKEESTADENGVSFRVVTDSTRIEELEDGPKVEAYRAVQIDKNGKIYSPMASRLKSTKKGTKQATNEAAQMNQWDEAVESLDKVDENGRITILDEDGGTTKVAYNPYGHCCVNSMMNDQFKRAWERDGLYVMKVLAPESELTAGYHAEKAKDVVGIHKWKTGAVGNKLPENKRREILLTRWMKNVKVMPWEEVAQDWIKTLEGENIDVPFNVVPRKILNMLAEAGVKIVAPEKGMENATKAYEQWLADPKGYVGNTELPDHVKALNEETDDEGPDNEPRFRTTGTPTDEVVSNGLTLTPAQTAEVAANIFAALPEESREKITDGLNGNILGLQDAIMQIPASLATKENWNEEDRAVAQTVREVIQVLVDANPTTRPLTTKEALWVLYDATNPARDLVGAASKAFVAHNLGFDQASMKIREDVDEEVRFRTASQGVIDAATDMYNYEVSLWTERLKESWLDMNQSVKSLQEALAQSSGIPVEPWENIIFALNQLSSKSYADKKKYMRDFLKPLWDMILEMVKKDHLTIEAIERYMMLKHGLERNRKLASRDAKDFYRAMYELVADRMKNQSPAQQAVALTDAQKALAAIDAKIAVASNAQLPKLLEARTKALYDVQVASLVLRGDEQQNQVELQAYYDAVDNETDPKYHEFREKDYGGLTSMFVDTTPVSRSNYKSEEAYQKALLDATKPRFDKVADMEAEAKSEVDSFESRYYVHGSLWNAVNAATKETLRHQYESGMITKEQYDAVRDMFEFYVPLRGFKENTAEDMYSYYMDNSAGGFAMPIVGAKGRKTRAESPLGWIGTMAESAIQADNKNEAKMALYYAILRRPDQGLLSITETWYEYTGQKDSEGRKIFKPAYPPAVTKALSADDLRQHMEVWENDMKNKQSRGEAYKGTQAVNLKGSVVFQDESETKEHIIRVKVAGKDYSILVNGNPRAAQAINGLLNPDANVGPVGDWLGRLRRGMSSLLTSFSPLFWVANYQRDLLSSFMRTSESSGWSEAFKYLANRRKAWRVASYIYKYEDTQLGNSYYENLYTEFAENGGITGYTVLTTNKEYEKLLEDYANVADKKFINAIKGIWDKFMQFGEAIEQVSRFAAYITARESGKSIEESVNAAKEVSVNFNRKGSAKPISLDEVDKLRTKDGKKLNDAQKGVIILLSAMPKGMKELYFFFNASVQALSSSAQLAKKSPGKATAWAGMYFGMSIVMAMINYLLSGDDDEEYLDLPDYLRHSTLLVKVSDGYYLKWSLPQEMRPFYAWADLLVSKAMGKMPHKNLGMEMALVAAQWLPVNPFDAEDPLLGLVPDYASPLAEAWMNKTSFGGRIYNDMSYKSAAQREDIPAYRKATEKTGKVYVDVAQLLNNISGGDEVVKGHININPSVVEHLVEGYGGGIYDFAKMMTAFPGMLISDDPVEVKKIPFVNKVVLSVDETNMYSHVNDAFRYYSGIADNAKRVENEYRQSEDPARADAYREEEDWRIYLLYQKYEEDFNNVKEKLDAAVDKEEEDLLRQEQNVLREMFLNDIAKGDIPEVTFQIREDVKRIDKEIREAMKPVSDANKERLEKKKSGDIDGMIEAIEKREALKETPEYQKAAELKLDLKEIKRQLEELGSVTGGAQRDSVIGEIQKNYDALLRKREEL